MTDPRKRIEELEARVSDVSGVLLRLVNYINDTHHEGFPLAEMAEVLEHPLLLSEQTETPVEETGDVERVRELVFKMLAEGTEYADVPYVELQRPRYQYLLQRVDYFAGLLAAMRPVSVDRERIKEIVHRHIEDDQCGTMDGSNLAERITSELLSTLEGVNHGDQ